ncbi:MAG: hypothetical protein NCW75_07555 [Phycisphaera sp.]|nr:MAG: hypothetical protein NCW75_07555 [Phycisphaera sp.]
MAAAHETTYEGWIEYAFTRGYAEFMHPQAGPRGANPYLEPEPATVARYMHRFCGEPPELETMFSDDQIGDGVWFLFGVGSGSWEDIRFSGIDPAMQARCVASVANLYTRCFDRLCCGHGTDPDQNFVDDLHLDGAVYMIWDMDQLQYLVHPIGELPHLAEPGLKVLETILHTCRTSTCLHSALHGLGHLHGELTPRIRTIIDGFLHARTPPPHLVEYARAARSGRVL